MFRSFQHIFYLVNAYGLNGMGLEAVQLFHKVPENILDDRIYVCALNACSHSGLVNEAYEIFGKIPCNQRTELICTTMVSYFIRKYLNLSHFALYRLTH